jgi:alkylated DNA repair dioxygenase AlkB
MRKQLQNGWIVLIEDFLSSNESQKLFFELLNDTPWNQGSIRLFGKEYLTPRLEAFYAEENLSYHYSGQTLIRNNFTPTLIELKQKIEIQTGEKFNSVLINLYRDGQDSNGWHADDEKELGKNPVIASLSLGETRVFDLKHNLSGEKISIPLQAGSLLVMGGELQHFWKHRIAKSKKAQSSRINLTYRNIKS